MRAPKQFPPPSAKTPARGPAPDADGPKHFWRTGVLAALVALAGVFFWWRETVPSGGLAGGSSPSSLSPTSTHGSPASPSAVTPAETVAETPAALPAARTPDTAATLAAAFADLEAFLRGSPSAKEIAEQLSNLRYRLTHAPRDAARAAILAYLGAGGDTRTTLPFKVGADGWLDSAPTLRVFMLDALGAVDPAAAAQFAKTILDSADASADEWAVSLRDYSQGDAALATDSYLGEKTRELVSNPAWLSQPTTGFLDAFDFVVFTQQANLAPQMAGYMDDPQQTKAVKYASWLTLDRLMLTQPAAVLAQLTAQPQLLDSAPNQRADLYARADVADPAQKAAVETYLLNPALSDAELAQFIAAFPLFSQGVSQNLVTPTNLPTLAEIAQRDVATLAVTQQWLTDPRFAARQTALQQLATNLQNNIASAQKGGALPTGK